MSIFSKIKGAKKAANEHKLAEAQKTPAEVVDKPVPYRHVPTHAASDALSAVPSSFKEEDRTAIRASHQRRTQRMSRNSSAMSMSFGGNRNSSYHGSDWSNNNGFGSYGMNGMMTPQMLETRKSFLGNNGTTYQSSPLASHAVSPTHSEHSTSSSSSQLMEMPYVAANTAVVRPELAAAENFPTNRTRKLGEAPLFDSPPPRMTPQAVTAAVTPVKTTKRSWGRSFGKRNKGLAAITAH